MILQLLKTQRLAMCIEIDIAPLMHVDNNVCHSLKMFRQALSDPYNLIIAAAKMVWRDALLAGAL